MPTYIAPKASTFVMLRMGGQKEIELGVREREREPEGEEPFLSFPFPAAAINLTYSRYQPHLRSKGRKGFFTLHVSAWRGTLFYSLLFFFLLPL